jgi:hypothetical protein
MTSPPSYDDAQPGSRPADRLPPYRASHTFASNEEELAALQEFAQSKLYVDQMSDGVLPSIYGGGGLKAMAFGGPMPASREERNMWPKPETEEERKARRDADKARKKEEKATSSGRKGSVVDVIGEKLKKVVSRGESKDSADGLISGGVSARKESKSEIVR